MEGTIYDDFGEGYNDTHGSLTLGYALVFNHVGAKEDKMVEKFSTGWVSMYFSNGEESTDGHYEAARDVAKGEQIFSYYGDDWFDYRTFDEISPAAVGDYYLKMADPFHGPTRVPGCPTTTLKVTDLPSLVRLRVFVPCSPPFSFNCLTINHMYIILCVLTSRPDPTLD